MKDHWIDIQYHPVGTFGKSGIFMRPCFIPHVQALQELVSSRKTSAGYPESAMISIGHGTIHHDNLGITCLF